MAGMGPDRADDAAAAASAPGGASAEVSGGIRAERPDLGDRAHLLAGPIEHSLLITKSEFIAYLAPVADVQAADRIIRERRALHPGARHHCTALVLGTPVSLQRSNDDGEPGGTAGMPMAQALRGRHLTNVVAVVTRYFGGVKLGAGGLTRAYGSAVTDALDAARARGLVRERVVREITEMLVPYELAGPFEAQVRAWAAGAGIGVHGAEYGADGLTLTLAHAPERRAEAAEAIAHLSSGAVTARIAGWAFEDVPLV